MIKEKPFVKMYQGQKVSEMTLFSISVWSFYEK